MSFALDYTPKLEKIIIKKPKEYFINDKGCPITWEPGRFDFLSPCLQEASLMLKVLSKDEYVLWLDAFLPNFREHPEDYLKPEFDVRI